MISPASLASSIGSEIAWYMQGSGFELMAPHFSSH